VTKQRKLVAAAALVLLAGRLLLLPSERRQRDEEVRGAYAEYCFRTKIEIFHAPGHPGTYKDCLGDFLRHSDEINRRHMLLSLVEPRHLLSGWKPIR
jgi:hypothetical protein